MDLHDCIKGDRKTYQPAGNIDCFQRASPLSILQQNLSCVNSELHKTGAEYFLTVKLLLRHMKPISFTPIFSNDIL